MAPAKRDKDSVVLSAKENLAVSSELSLVKGFRSGTSMAWWDGVQIDKCPQKTKSSCKPAILKEKKVVQWKDGKVSADYIKEICYFIKEKEKEHNLISTKEGSKENTLEYKPEEAGVVGAVISNIATIKCTC